MLVELFFITFGSRLIYQPAAIHCLYHLEWLQLYSSPQLSAENHILKTPLPVLSILRLKMYINQHA